MDVQYPQVRHELLSELKDLLPDHVPHFRPAIAHIYGIATFVKKDIPVLDEGEILIHKRDTDGLEMDGHHDRNLQWVKLQTKGKTLSIINVHGLWNGMGKGDTPSRVAQSQKIRSFVDSVEGPKIICDDFNLNPDTESLQIVRKGMRDLIAEHGVTSTRTSLYEKPGKYADYIFTSEEIGVKDFKVMPEEVSDHSALLLDFEV
jgi:endonuclease/exonuclease/phosphatase family metal-dependent hydrolase